VRGVAGDLGIGLLDEPRRAAERRSLLLERLRPSALELWPARQQESEARRLRVFPVGLEVDAPRLCQRVRECAPQVGRDVEHVVVPRLEAEFELAGRREHRAAARDRARVPGDRLVGGGGDVGVGRETADGGLGPAREQLLDAGRADRRERLGRRRAGAGGGGVALRGQGGGGGERGEGRTDHGRASRGADCTGRAAAR
jgi:hypothetical protein